jgi:hypothetical protein
VQSHCAGPRRPPRASSPLTFLGGIGCAFCGVAQATSQLRQVGLAAAQLLLPFAARGLCQKIRDTGKCVAAGEDWGRDLCACSSARRGKVGASEGRQGTKAAFANTCALHWTAMAASDQQILHVVVL